jgi:adenine-specific DNA-methyltransferase
LESQRTQNRRTFVEAQDEVDRQRESLIAAIEAKLEQCVTASPLLAIRWELG